MVTGRVGAANVGGDRNHESDRANRRIAGAGSLFRPIILVVARALA